MDKRGLSERDACTKFITPAIVAGGWDVQLQLRENVYLTKGRVIASDVAKDGWLDPVPRPIAVP